MADLSLIEKLKDLEEALDFGNHKGAKANPKVLRDFVEKDVTHDYGLVLPLSELKRIPAKGFETRGFSSSCLLLVRQLC